MSSIARTRKSAVRVVAVLGMVGVLAATAGCGSEDNEPSSQDAAGVDTLPSDTTSSSGSDEPEAEELISSFTDSFDDDRNGWAVPASEIGTADMQDGDYVWDSYKPELYPHFLPDTLGNAFDEGRLDMTDVRVTASVTPVRGLGTIGVFCRELPDNDAEYQWYEFMVRDGYAAIRLADDTQQLEVLAVDDDVELPIGEEATIEATCVNVENGDAELTLVLNGEQVLQAAVSDPLGNGAPGLQGYDSSAEESDEPMLIAWHDFSVEPAD